MANRTIIPYPLKPCEIALRFLHWIFTGARYLGTRNTGWPILRARGADTGGNCKRRLVGVQGKQYKAQRLAWLYMTGVWPDGET